MNGTSRLVISIKLTKDGIINIFVSLIIVALLIVNISTFYTYIPTTRGNMYYMILGLLSIAVCCIKFGFERQTYYFVFVIIYSLFGLMSYLYNGNSSIIELLWPLGFMGIGLLSLNFKLKPRMLEVCFFIFCAISIFNIFMAGGSRFISTQGSRNNISVYALVYLSLYFFSAYNNKISVSIIPVVVYFITCILATGRGGILTGAVLLLFMLIFDLRDGITKRRRLIFLIGSLIIAVLFFYIFNHYMGEYIRFSITQFQERGMSTSRNGIWTDYFAVAKSSFLNILFGAHIGGTITLENFSENLHNSVLMLHAKYGIFGVLLVFCLIFKPARRFIINNNMYYLIPLIGVFIRMMFDYTNFNGILDIILVNLILYQRYREGEMDIEKQAY